MQSQRWVVMSFKRVLVYLRGAGAHGYVFAGSAPGRTRTCDRLLRSYPRPSAIATWENAGCAAAS
jgi:hypothetical protein